MTAPRWASRDPRSSLAGAAQRRTPSESRLMSIIELCHTIQNTSWATGFRQANYAFPLVEGTHIMALSLSVGLILMLDLRLLRLAFQTQAVSKIMRQVMPWALPGFAIMFVTGVILFLAQAESVYTNDYFRVKMLMLLALGVNAAVYQYKFYPNMAAWDTGDTVPGGAKVIAAISLVFWMIVIACGRLMAYEL
jgi:Family of unknown function (DUF6644)